MDDKKDKLVKNNPWKVIGMIIIAYFGISVILIIIIFFITTIAWLFIPSTPEPIQNQKITLITPTITPLPSLSPGFNILTAEVSYGQMPIIEADTKTFKILSDVYAKDAKHVYYTQNIIQDADPATFSYVGGFYYAKDARHVYSQGHIIPGADSSTFTYLGGCYSKDASQVYALSSINDDPSGQKGFYTHLYLPETEKYYYIQVGFIPGADPATFTYIQGNNEFCNDYAIDKQHAYYRNYAIPGADLSTYTFAGDHYSKDKYHVYYQGKPIPAQSTTFTYIGGHYARDNTNIFYNSYLIPNVDFHTFEYLGDYLTAKDANHVYREGKVIPEATPSLCNADNLRACLGY